jgi:hypothetical protein
VERYARSSLVRRARTLLASLSSSCKSRRRTLITALASVSASSANCFKKRCCRRARSSVKRVRSFLALLRPETCGSLAALVRRRLTARSTFSSWGRGTWNESTKRAFLELRLRQYGVELECSIGRGGEEPTVDVARDIRSAADELERALLVRQLRAGKARKKALGRHVHGRLPYGYESDRGMLRPVRSLAPIVIRIFSEAARGSSPGQIARGLNEEGYQHPRAPEHGANRACE